MNEAYLDLSTKSEEWREGWKTCESWFRASNTWRGLCGHVWDRRVDGNECPRCLLIKENNELKNRLLYTSPQNTPGL